MKPAYYNEIDKFAAQWLRNLITAGHIAPGDVDERSIEDVHPSDLKPYTQCHFFAGIGVWSHALRRAGWPDDRPVWTGSCPCQPFSEAGSGTGFNDQRHLWPSFHWLIQECRPPTILGEQVASKPAGPWIDLVSTDMETLDYAVAACAFPASSVGAPHIRDRLYWCANSGQHNRGQQAASTNNRESQANRPTDRFGGYSGVADWSGSNIEWITCFDGRTRPIEPGICAVVDEYPSRVGRLRAYGNAINAEAARVFIEAAMSCMP